MVLDWNQWGNHFQRILANWAGILLGIFRWPIFYSHFCCCCCSWSAITGNQKSFPSLGVCPSTLQYCLGRLCRLSLTSRKTSNLFGYMSSPEGGWNGIGKNSYPSVSPISNKQLLKKTDRQWPPAQIFISCVWEYDIIYLTDVTESGRDRVIGSRTESSYLWGTEFSA